MRSRPSHSTHRSLLLPSVAIALCAILGVAVGTVAGGSTRPDDAPAAAPSVATESPSPSPVPSASAASPSPTPTTAPTVTFSLVAGGDVLPHMPVVRSATTDSGIDFSPLFEGISPWIAGADLGLCHLETPISPDGVASGYPVFAAPEELVGDLDDAGFDGCSTASNHSVDRGFDGLVVTDDGLEAAGMGFAGTARTEDEAAVTQAVRRHGVRPHRHGGAHLVHVWPERASRARGQAVVGQHL
ncbi:CapA family protein [Demequina litorisediminis]|uniref:CapA family protein n=1 Tax=Demequina litorisediminis TaxID=1849022 RepID=UPI0024E17BB1|nr:CapA family protein [Demequina litorisediminis]